MDETYAHMAGKPTYLYRAVDSAGSTTDFYLSPERDAAAAKQFFRKALAASNHPRPRVINVDGNPSYPKVVTELKQEQRLGAALPVSHLPLPEQYREARPPRRETADQR